MAFYKSISEYYHHIFPFNKHQLAFVENQIQDIQKSELLEVGCGVGELARGIADISKHVIGIDLDPEMIKKARQIEQANLSFRELNMLDLTQVYPAGSFNAIVCFGNTLVHLASEADILLFFKQARELIVPEGKLLIQIINYDRIINQKVTALSTIENESIRFIRNYKINTGNTQIDFDTELLLKQTGEEIKNSIKLLPIRKKHLDILLNEAGFTERNYYGNFLKAALLDESVPLIVSAS